MLGTTGEKKNDENSEATMIIDTTVELIRTSPLPEPLKVSSTYKGMITSTLRNKDYDTNNESRPAIRILIEPSAGA
jgi:hypothetical protein